MFHAEYSSEIPSEILVPWVEDTRESVDHWIACQPIVTSDQHGRAVMVWPRRQGGPNNFSSFSVFKKRRQSLFHRPCRDAFSMHAYGIGVQQNITY